ncbi:MAG: PIN domain-containing protein [Ignavibacteria bacterium]|nr:MAG: PIN domain-containing protein [Ignavibacteria bacterium]KAF0155296.1 MAG: PIN domain-containing protein [Ignavibacteria bacterium]
MWGNRMIYVFDDNSISNILNHYYIDRFPSFWEKLDKMISEGKIISVREAHFELQLKFNEEKVERLLQNNKSFFSIPSTDELGFITKIYSISHFRHNLERKKLLKGGFFADPFVIAKAQYVKGTVITEEVNKPHGAKIPNICEHFGILCENIEGFLLKEDWTF